MTSRISHSVDANAAGVRLDVWLWAARFFKTRALAKKAIEGGKVEINEAAGKPSKTVHAGDRLSIARLEERFEVEIVAISDRRGSAAVAQALFRETEASQAARAEAAERRRLERTGYAKPPTKPDKRARRLIIALGDIDAM